MRFTKEAETPNVRAMVAGFRPASNDARMRFAFPSGISAILAASMRDGSGLGGLDVEALSALPVAVPRFRLATSAATATCSR